MFPMLSVPKMVHNTAPTSLQRSQGTLTFFLFNTSSPTYPQSNGETERAVRTAKNLLKKSANPAKALLAYRAAPLGHGKSPAEPQFRRRLRTDLPTIPRSLRPKWPGLDEFKAEKAQRKRKQKDYFDTTDLRALVPGQRVWVVDQKKKLIVKSEAGTPRSYVVETPFGPVHRKCSSPWSSSTTVKRQLRRLSTSASTQM